MKYVPLRVLLALGAIAVGTLLLSRWMTDRGNYRHVVLISIDSLQRERLPFYGDKHDIAPHLTALAADSVLFDGAVTTATGTAAAVASTLTGLYPPACGVLPGAGRLSPNVPTLATILRSHGFHTGAFVSHAALQNSGTGLERGFDRYDGPTGPDGSRRAEATFRAAHRWLIRQAHNRAPVLLFFHLGPPQASDPHAGYDGAIAYDDRWLGALLDRLQLHGYYDQSIIVFTSDHGPRAGENPARSTGRPEPFDAQLRVPLLIHFPDNRYAGRRIRGPVQNIDILPTLLDALHIDAPGDLEGHSLMPLVRNDRPADPQRPQYTVSSAASQPPARIDQPLVAGKLVRSIRVWPVELISYPALGGPVYRLFNLEDDPDQKRDLSRVHPTVVARLAAALGAWQRATFAKPPTAPPPLSSTAAATLRASGYLQ